MGTRPVLSRMRAGRSARLSAAIGNGVWDVECPLLAISRLYRLIRGTSALPATADIGPTHRGIGVERRVEIDQVNALGLDAIAENLEVVAVVEGLHRANPLTLWPMASY